MRKQCSNKITLILQILLFFLSIVIFSLSFSINNKHDSKKLSSSNCTQKNTTEIVNLPEKKTESLTKSNRILKFIYFEERSLENKTYIADAILSKEQLGYNEAEQFCKNYSLELVSDKLDLSSAEWMSDYSFWIKSRVNLTTGHLFISHIFQKQALNLIQSNEAGIIYILQTIKTKRAEFWNDRKVICAINVNRRPEPFEFGYVCKDDIFDDEKRVKIRKGNNITCELLKLNSSFVEEFQFFNDSQPFIFFFNTGVPSLEFSPERDGFSWCNGQPIGSI